MFRVTTVQGRRSLLALVALTLLVAACPGADAPSLDEDGFYVDADGAYVDSAGGALPEGQAMDRDGTIIDLTAEDDAAVSGGAGDVTQGDDDPDASDEDAAVTQEGPTRYGDLEPFGFASDGLVGVDSGGVAGLVASGDASTPTTYVVWGVPADVAVEAGVPRCTGLLTRDADGVTGFHHGVAGGCDHIVNADPPFADAWFELTVLGDADVHGGDGDRGWLLTADELTVHLPAGAEAEVAFFDGEGGGAAAPRPNSVVPTFVDRLPHEVTDAATGVTYTIEYGTLEVGAAAGAEPAGGADDSDADDSDAGDGGAEVAAGLREEVIGFYDQFGAWVRAGDADALYDRLHPLVLEVYDPDLCRSYLANFRIEDFDVTVGDVGEPETWAWDAAGDSHEVVDAVPVGLTIRQDGQEVEQAAHVVLDGSDVLWFTRCDGSPDG